MNTTWLSWLLAVLACCVASFVCRRPQADSAEPESRAAEVKAIQRVLDEIISADNAGDLTRVMATYAEDAVLLPPNGPIVVGHGQISARYRNKLRLANRTQEVKVSDAWAYVRGLTIGEAIPVDGAASIKINDKYLMILWKEATGTWKIARLMWSPNVPQ